jgi:hypothetical protein
MRSSAVSRGKMSGSMALSRNAYSYCSNPRPRNQAERSMPDSCSYQPGYALNSGSIKGRDRTGDPTDRGRQEKARWRPVSGGFKLTSRRAFTTPQVIC